MEDDRSELVDFAVDYATKKGASYAEARYEGQEQESFILKNGVLDALYIGDDRGIGVRVLVDGALGFTATNSLTKPDVRGIVDDAVKIAKASRRRSRIVFAHEDAITMNWSVPEQKKLADVSVARLEDTGPYVPAQQQPDIEVFRELGGVPHPVVQPAAAGVLLPHGHGRGHSRTVLPELRLVRRMGGRADVGLEQTRAR